jgi:hypothetical protein
VNFTYHADDFIRRSPLERCDIVHDDTRSGPRTFPRFIASDLLNQAPCRRLKLTGPEPGQIRFKPKCFGHGENRRNLVQAKARPVCYRLAKDVCIGVPRLASGYVAGL